MPLMLLCQIKEENGLQLTMNEINNLNLSDINFNYNFILSYSNKEEIIIDNNIGDYIRWKYPDILDFTSKYDLTFTLYGGKPFLEGITLNPKSADLECKSNYPIVQCSVPKSHFKGQKSGYFYIYHSNHKGGKTIFYESNPFQVILPDEPDDTDSFKINRISFISFLGLCLMIL